MNSLTTKKWEDMLDRAAESINAIKKTKPLYEFRFIDLGYRVHTGEMNEKGVEEVITVPLRVPTHIAGIRIWRNFGVEDEYDEVPTKLTKDEQMRYIHNNYAHLSIHPKFLPAPVKAAGSQAPGRHSR